MFRRYAAGLRDRGAAPPRRAEVGPLARAGSSRPPGYARRAGGRRPPCSPRSPPVARLLARAWARVRRPWGRLVPPMPFSPCPPSGARHSPHFITAWQGGTLPLPPASPKQWLPRQPLFREGAAWGLCHRRQRQDSATWGSVKTLPRGGNVQTLPHGGGWWRSEDSATQGQRGDSATRGSV